MTPDTTGVAKLVPVRETVPSLGIAPIMFSPAARIPRSWYDLPQLLDSSGCPCESIAPTTATEGNAAGT